MSLNIQIRSAFPFLIYYVDLISNPLVNMLDILINVAVVLGVRVKDVFYDFLESVFEVVRYFGFYVIIVEPIGSLGEDGINGGLSISGGLRATA